MCAVRLVARISTRIEGTPVRRAKTRLVFFARARAHAQLPASCAARAFARHFWFGEGVLRDEWLSRDLIGTEHPACLEIVSLLWWQLSDSRPFRCKCRFRSQARTYARTPHQQSLAAWPKRATCMRNFPAREIMQLHCPDESPVWRGPPYWLVIFTVDGLSRASQPM
jgi:hypothetical protein